MGLFRRWRDNHIHNMITGKDCESSPSFFAWHSKIFPITVALIATIIV